MPRICYVEKDFQDEALYIIGAVREVCKSYAAQGYDLTLRQLYYQFVANDLFPDTRRWTWNEQRRKWERDDNGTTNADPNYKWLGGIVNDARLAGYLDWDFIVDRTRNLKKLSHWKAAVNIVADSAEQFRHERWADQPTRVEVWIEKDALVGVLQSACPEEDVPYFSCRGYTSQSELWGAAQRLGGYMENGQSVVILHLGDHDPSGIDMTRDIEERLAMFIAQDIRGLECNRDPRDYVDELADWSDEPSLTVERIALNMDQIKQYKPPPNPAKLTDSRAQGYIRTHGKSSWELDALEPTVLVGLIRAAINNHRDKEIWQASTEREETEREPLTAASERWSEVVELLSE